MAKTSYAPTRDDLEALVPEIVRVISQSYAFLIWCTQVFPRIQKIESGYYVNVENTLIEGSLLNLRKLNEFFKTDAKRNDDARAVDFPGFTGGVAFLKESDLKEIHKRFAHLTYHSVREPHVVWNLARATESALKASVPFLEHLVHDFYAGDVERAKLVIALHNSIPRVLAEVEKVRKLEESGKRIG